MKVTVSKLREQLNEKFTEAYGIKNDGALNIIDSALSELFVLKDFEQEIIILETGSISIEWDVVTVMWVAKRIDHILTEKQATEILLDIERTHDSRIGINIDVIETHIEYKGQQMIATYKTEWEEPQDEEELEDLSLGHIKVRLGGKVGYLDMGRRVVTQSESGGSKLTVELDLDNGLGTEEDEVELFEYLVDIPFGHPELKYELFTNEVVGEINTLFVVVKKGLTQAINLEQ